MFRVELTRARCVLGQVNAVLRKLYSTDHPWEPFQAVSPFFETPASGYGRVLGKGRRLLAMSGLLLWRGERS